ncbi:S41 family peptidase [Elizabethkingia ursingii]|uniref:S41 family peptidase n=1 Tax=Elizabethkingia ursingii TaxID=1756150 RepID=UPI002012AA05|nr:S41 family peptidase [Elizabethkingia ursingii]MCL1667876.1 S41 family peptidase [Elizabethkingia ursingii]
MKKLFTLTACLLLSWQTCAQSQNNASSLNLSFEETENNIPKGWSNFGDPKYTITIDHQIKQDGKSSLLIEGSGEYKAIGIDLPENYNGKSITLSGYIKTENVSDGFAGLWMRIDPKIAFDNMQDRGITGTSEWKKYEVTLSLNPKETKKIIIGAILTGKGKMWVDNLSVTIDGKDIKNSTVFTRIIPKAEKDKEFNPGSRITEDMLTKIGIENLKELGLIWGFLKYFHPNTSTGAYNWDYELFRIVPKLAEAPKNKNIILTDWIKSYGVFEQSKYKNNTKDIKLKADLSWINNLGYSNELTDLLLKIKDAKRNESNYYIELAPQIGNPVFKNENLYADKIFPDAGFRLLSLFKYWNIIQYFFPYKDLIKEDWKNVLTEFIPKYIANKDETEYTLTSLEIIARVHDTHANIWGNNQVLYKYYGERFSAPNLKFVGDKAIVIGFHDEKLGNETGLKPGDEILEINGIPINKIIKDKLKLTPASNYPTQLRDISFNLLRSNQDKISIKFSGNNGIQEKILTTYSFKELNPYNLRFKKDTPYFSMIGNDIGYLYLGTIKSEYLPSVFEKIQNTKGLIIDIRNYPSEFVVFSLGKYLMPKSTDFVKFTQTSVTQPGTFSMSENLKVGVNNPHYYKGKVAILVNEISQSQAEYTTMAFRVAPKAKVFGSTTAAADGNVSGINLPGNISTMISGIGIFYPNGDETQRVGIIPDVEIKPTIPGIKAGKDEILDKATEWIKQ